MDMINLTSMNNTADTIAHNLTILVVDDNHDMREIMEEIIICYGHRSDSATNGQEAVKMAMIKKYDLILMDIQMPVMDGFQALEILKRNHVTAPVAALTAHNLTVDQVRCFAAGFDYYFSKPINFKVFKALLDSLSGQRLETYQERSPAL